MSGSGIANVVSHFSHIRFDIHSGRFGSRSLCMDFAVAWVLCHSESNEKPLNIKLSSELTNSQQKLELNVLSYEKYVQLTMFSCYFIILHFVYFIYCFVMTWRLDSYTNIFVVSLFCTVVHLNAHSMFIGAVYDNLKYFVSEIAFIAVLFTPFRFCWPSLTFRMIIAEKTWERRWTSCWNWTSYLLWIQMML